MSEQTKFEPNWQWQLGDWFTWGTRGLISIMFFMMVRMVGQFDAVQSNMQLLMMENREKTIMVQNLQNEILKLNGEVSDVKRELEGIFKEYELKRK